MRASIFHPGYAFTATLSSLLPIHRCYSNTNLLHPYSTGQSILSGRETSLLLTYGNLWYVGFQMDLTQNLEVGLRGDCSVHSAPKVKVFLFSPSFFLLALDLVSFCCFEIRFSFLHSPCWSRQSSCYSNLRAGNQGGVTMVQLVQLRIQCCGLPRRCGFLNTDPGPSGNMLSCRLGVFYMHCPEGGLPQRAGNGFFWQSTPSQPPAHTEATFIGEVGNSVSISNLTLFDR